MTSVIRISGGRVFSLAAALALLWSSAAFAQDPFAGMSPERVIIRDHHGDAMNPFISRDGRSLFFNTRGHGSVPPDLLVAVRIDARTFRSLGPVRGANSSADDLAASLDRGGTLYWVSTRDYVTSLTTLFVGRFAQAQVRGLRHVRGLEAVGERRRVFDAEISRDGRSLYFAEGEFIFDGATPWRADLFLARRTGEGRFVRDARAQRLFARLNTGSLEYAPATSADELQIFFTRASRAPFIQPSIWRATRPAYGVPFGAPVKLPLEGHVEAPSVARDGSVYFHRRAGGRYRIYHLPRKAAVRAPVFHGS